jgi:hypothetical protein
MSMKRVKIQDGHSVPYELNGLQKLASPGETVEMLADVAEGLSALGAVAILPTPTAAKKG